VTVDWSALTTAQARRLRVQARRLERETGARFERGDATEAEFIAAVEAEENLTVFIACGLKPGEH
jgi:hypothetical protein